MTPDEIAQRFPEWVITIADIRRDPKGASRFIARAKRRGERVEVGNYHGYFATPTEARIALAEALETALAN